ncbi:MAG TPA: quinone oxidoreductase [Aggregatilineales bacterium]|nr:quinone oxidoreductase [Aggregatilineales bacterium]
MKKIVVHEYGEPDVMKLEEVPMPEPGPGQLRIKIEAIGLNYIDTYKRSGAYKGALPMTPGEEAAGVIDAVGEGVTEFKVGQRAAYSFVQGAYAQYSVIPAEKALLVPDNLDTQTAAAALLQGMTAHYLTHDTFPLGRGHTALIHAAAGGTGQLVVQLAKLRGARVIATVGSAEKAALVRDLGADEVIIYTQQDFEAEVKRLTGGKGVDVVYDSVGKDTFDKGLNLLRPRGYMVLFGQASGAVGPLDPQVLNAKGSIFLTRPSLGHYLLDRAELVYRANDVFSRAASGALKVRIDRRFPLADAAEAHRALTSRGTAGKVLLLP